MDTAAEGIIRTEGLSKVYRANGGNGPLTAVDQLDLVVRAGENFALLGPNGAGKTTTVGMLTTRVIPTAGQAWVGGVDVVAEPARAKELIGVVSQHNTLDRSLTVWENLYFHGRYFGMSAPDARSAADERLVQFRLSAKARTDVGKLSGGMMRRLMTARAMLHHPAVLFLDEPTAGLDPQSRLALWEILDDLHESGQTILLTTHYMQEADQFCDRVAIMDHGQVLALDTPAGLKASLPNGDGAAPTVGSVLTRYLERVQAPAGFAAPVEDREAAEGALRQAIDAADRLGLRVDDATGGEVTLETIFIHLTGRDLRE